MYNQIMQDTTHKPRKVRVTDELFEELKLRDDEIRESRRNAIHGPAYDRER